MTPDIKHDDATADACASAPEASMGTPVDLPDDMPTAHAPPPLRDDQDADDTPVYDDRTDDRPAP